MSTRRPTGSRLVAAATVLVIFASLTVGSTALATAGPPPNRLDDNTGRSTSRP